MSRIYLSLLAGAALLLGGCAATVKQASWVNPEKAGTKVRSVLVIGAARQDINRRLFEDELGRQLAAKGVNGIASYRHMDLDTLQDKKAALAKVRELGADGVIIATVVDQRTEQLVTPGSTYFTGGLPAYFPRHSSDHWHDHYLNSYQVVTRPPTVTNYEVATVETNLYGADQEMIWSMRSETQTASGKQLDETIKEFVGIVVEDLVANGLI